MRESIIEVLKTLGEAIGLVILVMFLFLQNWRSTLIPAITIPVSLIGTFAFVKLFGFSINTLTLFGIVLATGIVVDDAIVVIENIERHMREFRQERAPGGASTRCARCSRAVVVIGIVLVAVFVPVAFFPGTTGRMYQQFSLTIAFAVVLSVFNAVTFTPALSALLLDRQSHAHGRFFTARQPRHRRRHAAATSASCGGARWQLAMLVGVRRRAVARPGTSTAPCRRRSCRTRTRATSSPSSRRPRARRSSTPTNIAKQAEKILLQQPESLAVVLGRRLQLQRRGAEPAA